MTIDQATQDIAKTISALMTLADEDPKQNTVISAADIIELLQLTKHVIKNNIEQIPFDSFKHDPFLNRHFEYTKKECIEAIDASFSHASYKQPFSVFTLFKSRVLSPIIHVFRETKTTAFIDVYFNHLITIASDDELTVHESITHIIKTSKQQSTNRLVTIRKAVEKLT